MLLRFLRSYFLQFSSLSPDDPIFKEMQGPDVNMSAESVAFKRILAKGNALTFFYRSNTNEIIDPIMFMKPEYCAGIHPRSPTDPLHTWHDTWHKNPAEMDHRHEHLAEDDLSPITPQELKCFLYQLRRFHLEYNLCNDEQPCLLTDADAARLQKEYEEFYKNNLPVQEQLNDLLLQEFYGILGNITKRGIVVFLYSFLQTLLKNYFKPYLQTHIPDIASNRLLQVGLQSGWKMIDAIKTLEAAVTFALTFSLARVSFSFILENAFAPALLKIGIKSELTKIIITQLSTAAAFINNPTSILELALTGTVASAGQVCAYNVIKLLPKIKIEPAPSNQREEQAAVIRSENLSLTGSELRNRK